MAMEERIDYIVKNDNNLTLDEEINLLLDVYYAGDDKEYAKKIIASQPSDDVLEKVYIKIYILKLDTKKMVMMKYLI